MKKRVAVVFDSAGTLLHMYRVAKDMSDGSVLEDIQTTLLVAEKANRALVVLRTRFDDLWQCSHDLELREFIDMYNIPLGISCSSSPFKLEDVYRVIRGNTVKVRDIYDVVSHVKGRCPEISYLAAGLVVDSLESQVPYVLSTGGRMYSSTLETINTVRELGVDIFIASGDDAQNLQVLASSLSIPMKDVFPVATTHDKERIVKNLKNDHDIVVMVGDGMNDILALRAADIGILTSQQGDERPQVLKDSADIIIGNIIDVVNIIKNMGELITS
ncbi:Cu+-exporting ATPase [Methanolobus vulcani]|jgi:Soluble P-type ATPase|uniref:Cu+-exporting ATPase n=1 Tax=Methanolobus vulcani TaxID=38026 RepID=A0A7Z7FD92_9EURY|nr:HAD family hydrolase [Methanolobus vulcani]SDG11971.1 Cu+-exporting ATPase [Methanolobus vulcani]